MVEGLAIQRGETIVSHGAAAANALCLTTQVPMRAVYLTSGRSRRLKLGAQTVEFRHAPLWQLIFPGRAAGEVVRALAWLGPEKAGEAIRMLRAKLPPFVRLRPRPGGNYDAVSEQAMRGDWEPTVAVFLQRLEDFPKELGHDT
jgi:hypothetical protein